VQELEEAERREKAADDAIFCQLLVTFKRHRDGSGGAGHGEFNRQMACKEFDKDAEIAAGAENQKQTRSSLWAVRAKENDECEIEDERV
jgi:hypothetical protein